MYEINVWWYCGAIVASLFYGIWGFRAGMEYAREEQTEVPR